MNTKIERTIRHEKVTFFQTEDGQWFYDLPGFAYVVGPFTSSEEAIQDAENLLIAAGAI